MCINRCRFIPILPKEREVREGGRKSTDWLKWGPKERERSEGGRMLSTGWLNPASRVREEREGGRSGSEKEIGRTCIFRNKVLREGGRIRGPTKKKLSNVRWSREGGRCSKGFLKQCFRVREVRLGGREESG